MTAAQADTRLADLARSNLRQRERRWFDGLGRALAQSYWHTIEDSFGLNRRDYGTARFLAKDGDERCDEVAAVPLPDAFGSRSPLVVERLHGCALRRYSDLGLRFHEPDELGDIRLAGRLKGALQRLGAVPGAAAAIGSVLAVIHIAKPEGPDYDVSYSDPEVPFSIFVGIDDADQSNGDLRVAEGILHECMHLQLTLIEGALPMVTGNGERHLSPWQRTMRPAQGVLHGLYVFRVVQDLCRAMLEGGRCTAPERAYFERRITTIEAEVCELSGFASNGDLTADGREFARALLAA